MQFTFKAKIYKIGINWAVDVPVKISNQLIREKGYIQIKGTINNFPFSKSLVPVKDSPYRLFVNYLMMKGGKTALGKTATFSIEQDHQKKETKYPMSKLLRSRLSETGLVEVFDNLTAARKMDILRYLDRLKTEETLIRNVEKVIAQLKRKEKDVRVP